MDCTKLLFKKNHLKEGNSEFISDFLNLILSLGEFLRNKDFSIISQSIKI
ncbi:hypothetical protein L1283_001984 [Sphingobacterium sp. HSC-15S19]